MKIVFKTYTLLKTFLKKEIVLTILKTLSMRHHKDMLLSARVSQLLTSAILDQSSLLVFQC